MALKGHTNTWALALRGVHFLDSLHLHLRRESELYEDRMANGPTGSRCRGEAGGQVKGCQQKLERQEATSSFPKSPSTSCLSCRRGIIEVLPNHL